MNLRQDLDAKLGRFEELERRMSDPAVLANGAKIAEASREHGSLARVANQYRLFKSVLQQIAEANALAQSADADERELAQAEIVDLKARREKLWEDLLDMTVGGADASRARCVMEVRAGTGGEEAALFAGNLFEMYKRHCQAKGWKVELFDASPSEMGGFKEIIFGVEGEGCFRELRYESGGHRVQRVPETEAKGRVHTSAATVAVLAEPEDVEVDIKPDDYRKDLYCASGPGGQHVNKTQSAVRLSHYETGIVVAMQDERSQHKNFAKALRVLKTRLYEHYAQQEHAKRSQERRDQVGSGDRSERIRTYNFPENRVTDHRINFTLYKLDAIMAGNIQPLTDALIEHDRKQLRESMGALD